MATHNGDDATIAAIATPPGPGGIGIIRVSGKAAHDVYHHFFRPFRPKRPLQSHLLRYGWMVDPETGRRIDEVLAVFMRAPHTYTREDVAEFHCHGSYVLLEEILQHILRFPDVRLAAPGEFTKRAFLNGRIDLTRAEAVIELLTARTAASAHKAVDLLSGSLASRIEKIRGVLLEVKAILEVAIDFPDEEAEITTPDELAARLEEQAARPLFELAESARRGRILQEGVSVVILGRPNVGKSSLLNLLLREERAIVTDLPGTTRDTIEEHLDICGLPVRIIDTAGIREQADQVEEAGIRRALAKAQEADLVLFLFDAAEGWSDEDQRLFERLGKTRCLVIGNKMDKLDGAADHVCRRLDREVIFLSARTGQGLDQLERAIFREVTGRSHWDPGDMVVPAVRHSEPLRKAAEAARLVAQGLGQGLAMDLAALEVQEALDCLGEITGETTTEDVLDAVFSRFCIGK